MGEADLGFKTVEEAREELISICPLLYKKYTIKPFETIRGDEGVQLFRDGFMGHCSIVSARYLNGGCEGLYEVNPIRGGKNFKELFNATDAVTAGLPLEDALIIAEATINFPIGALKVVAEKYFHCINSEV